MGYYIDLSSISIEAYKKKLGAAYLPPSRMILKENTDERFCYFLKMGIKNLKELLLLLKKKENFNELSKVNCFSHDYLTILLRELNSIHPKPNKIKDFPGVSAETAEILEKVGIKDTLSLYEKVKDKSGRQKLTNDTQISDSEILMLTKFADLSRIKWVGVTFVKMLFDLGTDTVEKASMADAVELHKKINQLIKEKNNYKVNIGLNDIRIFVETAKEVPLEIVY
jgi:hypothetical protein